MILLYMTNGRVVLDYVASHADFKVRVQLVMSYFKHFKHSQYWSDLLKTFAILFLKFFIQMNL